MTGPLGIGPELIHPDACVAAASRMDGDERHPGDTVESSYGWGPHLGMRGIGRPTLPYRCWLRVSGDTFTTVSSVRANSNPQSPTVSALAMPGKH